MSNVIEFRQNQGLPVDDSDDLPDDATMACPVCRSGLWQLRHDGKVECAASHLFSHISWSIE